MNRSCLSLACLCSVLSVSACLVDKQLGDPDADAGTGSSGTDGATTASPTDGNASMSATSASATAAPGTMSASATASASDTDDSDTDVSGTDTASDTDETAGSPLDMCSEWAPPPFDCEIEGDAIAEVTTINNPGDFDDEECRIVLIEQPEPDVDAVTIDCGFEMTFDIKTTPHFDLPFGSGQDILFSSRESFEAALTGAPPFVIRDTDGELLMAWVNELDLESDVDISPVTYATSLSGCPGFSVQTLCEDAETILSQRIMVELADSPVTLFAGYQGVINAGGADLAVIVDRAQEIVCWDESCIGDDSGPFDELKLFFVQLPEA